MSPTPKSPPPKKSPPKKASFADEAELTFSDPAAWAAWLKAHHATSGAVWLRMARKHTGIASIDYAGALEVALCWGWIDGQRASLDASYFRQRFSRRVARSPWSKVNVAKCEALLAAGKMEPPGQSEIDRAKADGRWQRAYDSPAKATVPDDLQAALDASPEATAHFATLNAQNRFAVLYRIQAAVKPETRARRIQEFVALLARGETLHPVGPKRPAA